MFWDSFCVDRHSHMKMTQEMYPVLTLLVVSVTVTTARLQRDVPWISCNSSLNSCAQTSCSHSSNMSIRQRDTDPLVTSVVYLLDRLRWNKIIFLYDDTSDDLLQSILEDLKDTPYLVSMYIHRVPPNLQPTSAIKDLLQELHRKLFPDLHIVLLSAYSSAYQLLRLVEQHDLDSNRTTDFRHYSFWIVACFNQCQPSVNVLPHIHEMENVALVNANTAPLVGSSIQAKIFTLSSIPGGRKFTMTSDIGHMSGKDLRDAIFPNEKYGFNNRTLVVSAMKSRGLMNVDKGYSGYLREILDAMAEKLNFSFVIGLPPDKRWGQKINNDSWDGLIGQLVRREVDLVVSTVTIHHEREEEMDFLLPPTFTEVFDIIYRLQEDKGEDWQIYFKPFNPVVFFILLGVLVAVTVLAAILICCEDEILNKQKGEGKYNVFTAADIFFYLFGFLLVRGVNSIGKHWTSRLLFFTWGLFSVVISATFCAKLVAFFAVQRETLPFQSLAELVEQDEYKFGMESGDVREVIFRNTKYGDRKDAWDKIVKINRSDPDVLHEDIKVHTAKMFAEKYAYFTSRRFGAEHVSKDCRVRLVGTDVMWHQYGIGVPQDYPPKKDFERLLSLMADNGLFDVWYERWRVIHENKCAVDNSVKKLTLTDVQTAFYVLCGGIGAAGVVLIAEWFVHKLREEKSFSR